MSDTVSCLRDVRLLKDFSAAEVAALADRVVKVTVGRGDVLFWEGDPGDHMYFVREGQLVISKIVADGVDEVLGRVGPGEFLGEMSLLDGAPRCATARAETPAVLYALDRRNFEEFIAESPRVAALFFRAQAATVVERLRASDDLVTETARWGLESTGLDVRANA
jgi:CRP-like cAMP-binding protein